MLDQVRCGAHILDVNAGVVYNDNPDPNITEPPLIKKLINLVQSLTDVPICIDSSVPAALEAGLEAARGRPSSKFSYRRRREIGNNSSSG